MVPYLMLKLQAHGPSDPSTRLCKGGKSSNLLAIPEGRMTLTLQTGMRKKQFREPLVSKKR
jgi:hypothetical protein